MSRMDLPMDFDVLARPADAAPPAVPVLPVAPAPQPGGTGATKDNYPPAAATPTQAGPRGIRFDFNLGARVVVPALTEAEGAWRVCLRDLDTGNILFQTTNQGAVVSSAKRWFIRFRIEVEVVDEAGVAEAVLTHDYDARGRDVLIQFPIGTLGDTMGWFGYAVRFAERHGCRLICALSGLIIPLLQNAYPDIVLITHQDVVDRKLADSVYATYCLGLFFDDKARDWQPTDFRHVGLHRTAGYILGVDPTDAPPALALPDETRPIDEPYVCIGVQSSSGAKNWNNPFGWSAVVAFLKAQGCRVICIDQKATHGTRLMWTHIPHGAEDHTGDHPLTERARWLRHAAAFVGLSSGLAWLAWAAGCPVVLISGFTHADNEFHTPYRVINWHVCNSCWNDPAERFDHKDYLWCPRHAGTPRHFECTRLITAEQVIAAIRRIPDLCRPDPA
jgi:autotransporter strand-loop-strand O-heptosyltransferase